MPSKNSGVGVGDTVAVGDGTLVGDGGWVAVAPAVTEAVVDFDRLCPTNSGVSGEVLAGTGTVQDVASIIRAAISTIGSFIGVAPSRELKRCRIEDPSQPYIPDSATSLL